MGIPSTWTDACTLPTAEQPLRVAEWDDLAAASLLAVERRSATRATLTFAGGDELARRIQQLADAESACCSFFTFTVTPRGDRTDLDIEVPDGRAGILAALVERARTSS